MQPGKNPLIKICDFGYSIDDQSSLPKTKVGTPGYTGEAATASPEPGLILSEACSDLFIIHHHHHPLSSGWAMLYQPSVTG